MDRERGRVVRKGGVAGAESWVDGRVVGGVTKVARWLGCKWTRLADKLVAKTGAVPDRDESLIQSIIMQSEVLPSRKT